MTASTLSLPTLHYINSLQTTYQMEVDVSAADMHGVSPSPIYIDHDASSVMQITTRDEPHVNEHMHDATHMDIELQIFENTGTVPDVIAEDNLDVDFDAPTSTLEVTNSAELPSTAAKEVESTPEVELISGLQPALPKQQQESRKSSISEDPASNMPSEIHIKVPSGDLYLLFSCQGSEHEGLMDAKHYTQSISHLLSALRLEFPTDFDHFVDAVLDMPSLSLKISEVSPAHTN